jgi:rare lipoprotein A
VLPYPYTYLVSAFHPRSFRTTGITYSAVCSWYGPGFNGKPTASGQVYNQDDFTCASRTLAFGTWLALSRDGKRIVVVVTDRGPYVSGRDLDLSKAAADALGFSGVESVQVEVVTPGT